MYFSIFEFAVKILLASGWFIKKKNALMLTYPSAFTYKSKNC